MSEPNKCVDCGFELDYSDEDIPQCFRCDSQEWKRMLDKATAELKELREFVGAIDTVSLHDPYHGVWTGVDGQEVFAFRDSECDIITTGTDPFDAWRKMNAGEGE